MNNTQKPRKKLLMIDENSEIIEKKSIPPLKLCCSPKTVNSSVEGISLTMRIKKRIQVNRSLDFNLASLNILSPKFIRADHNIVVTETPRASSHRQGNLSSTIVLNNRKISKNMLLDQLP